MIICCFKTLAITMIVTFGLLFPAMLIFNYAKPWNEAIEIIKEEYPSNIWIPQGGSYHGRARDSGMETIRRELSYLVLPENKTIHFLKERRNEIKKVTEDGGLASFIFGIAILYGLFFWQAPKVPGRIKGFLDRKSGYL